MGFEMKNAHQNLERDGRYACTVVYARETAPGTRQNMPEDTKIKVEDWLQSMLVKEFGASINVNPYFFGGEPVEGMSSASLAMVAADITKRQETLSIENGLLILNPS